MAMTERSLLESLFQNLLHNSLAYCHPERRPLAQVAAERVDRDTWRFSVGYRHDGPSGAGTGAASAA